MYFSYDNLYRHYLACRRNKRNTWNALRFEVRQELELLQLQDELTNRTYRPTSSVCFITKRPKLREIFAADFRDRVVHHVLVDYLETIWEPLFIHDSYACRRGKGVHKGVDRLQKFIRQVTCNGQRRAYYLQLDITNYFMRIDKRILWDILEPRIQHSEMRWLTRLLVFHDCTDGYVFRGDARELLKVPAHKSLLMAGQYKGLPIGNLNSQFFANVYLNLLDQFVKHQLKCRYYLRYCDDFVLLSHNKKELLVWHSKVSDFLRKQLLLELNPTRERLLPVSDGVDFLGYIVRADYLLVRRRVINHLKEKLQTFERLLVRRDDNTIYYSFDEAMLNQLHSVLSSYLGHFKKANTDRLWRSLWWKYDFLHLYFSFDEANKKLTRKYLVPKQLSNVRQQYSFFRMMFPDDILFFQVGRFFEFYSPLPRQVLQLLKLSPVKKSSRYLHYGFPVCHENSYLRCLLTAGWSVVVITQTNSYLTGVKRRIPKVKVLPI